MESPDSLYRRKHDLYHLNAQVREVQMQLMDLKIRYEGPPEYGEDSHLFLTQAPNLTVRMKEKLARLKTEENRLRTLIQEKKVYSTVAYAVSI